MGHLARSRALGMAMITAAAACQTPAPTLTPTPQIIAAKEYKVPAASAKDPTATLNLYAYEKYDRALDPSAQARNGRIVLVLHGSTVSGRVDFDVQVPGIPLEKTYSLLDQLARRGYDAWTLDYQNYGRSDHHDCGLCVNTEAASRDVETVAKFILKERGADKLHLIGWSWGGEMAGLFAQRNPAMVGRLVLYAPALDVGGRGQPLPTDQFRANSDTALIAFFHPTGQIPEAVDAFLKAAREFDSRSPNGAQVDARTNPMKIDPTKITTPTLVIYGADDSAAPPGGPNATAFLSQLGAKDKKRVLVPDAGHGLFLERQRDLWYQEVLAHLESATR